MEELKHKKGGGSPRRISVQELHARVRQVDLHFCKGICTLAQKIGVPKSTLHDAMKRGLLRTTKSHIKPILTEANKAACVAYCLGNIQDNCFTSMFNRVDIDKKWFYLFQVNTKYILVSGEKPPHRVCRHKSHIPKAMCLPAVARPCPNPVTGVWWDGKIGSWFFVEQVPAVRSSHNRPVGTLETRTVNVIKVTSEEMYINKLLPAIMEKWPAWEERIVKIQLDNAPVHPQPGRLGERLNQHLTQLQDEAGWDIDIIAQPANSPDTNMLDLAFFRAIQTL